MASIEMAGLDAASRALGRALGPVPAPAAGGLLGLEHEFVVRDRGGATIDVRTIVHGLGCGRRDLDPADPHAYRLRSGAVVTCDEAEAEVAIAPQPGGGDFASRVVRSAAAARGVLRRKLPTGLRLEGWSTHISVSVSDRAVRAVAERYATTFAPALMLLLDLPRSPGLLIRPRPGRLELGGEYVAGAALLAAVTFAAGSARALAEEILGGRPISLPPLEGRIRAADVRQGWYVDRRAFGEDLYARGRAAALPLRGGGVTSAQERLEAAWAVARAALVGSAGVDEEDLRLTDAVVAGRLPLPMEPGRIPSNWLPAATGATPHPFGTATRIRVRPALGIAPVMLTWDLAVYLVQAGDHSRHAFIAVPGRVLERFQDAFDDGALDSVLAGYLGRPAEGRRLDGHAQTHEPGMYDELGPRLALLAPEPGVAPAPGRRVPSLVDLIAGWTRTRDLRQSHA